MNISICCASSCKLLQNVIFLFFIAWNWLEVFHEIRRMTPSLLLSGLVYSLSSQRLRIAAAIQEAPDRPKSVNTRLVKVDRSNGFGW